MLSTFDVLFLDLTQNGDEKSSTLVRLPPSRGILTLLSSLITTNDPCFLLTNF